MRSRSSRLFVVLLHLVGISNNLPNNPFQRSVGIVGVHPLSILLEPLELQAAGGLGELLSLLEGAGYDVDKTVLNEPFWLQDDTDGTCLGPSGFSECGDSTLWNIRRRLALFPKKRRRQSSAVDMKVADDTKGGLLAYFQWSSRPINEKEQQQWEYALELADVNTSIASDDSIGNSSGNSTTIIENDKTECLYSMQSIDSVTDHEQTLQMGPCEADEAWSWNINEGGVLAWDKNQATIRQEKRQDFHSNIFLGGLMTRFLEITSDIEDSSPSMCVRRTNDGMAVTASCDPRDGSSLISFSVIQYQNSAAVSPQLPRFPRHKDIVEQSAESPLEEEENDSPIQSNNEYRTSTSQQHEANENTMINGLKQSIGAMHTTTATAKKEHTPLHGGNKEILSPLGVGGYFERTVMSNKPYAPKNGNLLHKSAPSPVASPIGDVHRSFKIPVHPYIEAAEDGYYKDEVTQLSYPTDISEYLGHDRQEVGRHTLTGVGLYTRTAFKIKIYGVAFYVPKRQILADPIFNEFADMSVEELRENDAFYDHLIHGKFDKTLFIQLNMQLATETVRQSLTGDWQLLIPEHKQMLYDSSARYREADERMLKTISSEENTSNCSCGQSAPPEFNVDPSCCARGTEMVFTWRKNGDMDLRIDGRLMDTFPYPEMAKGIFFEYLRRDEPMSMDARDHFVDGFPFLLSPLAMLKGVVGKKESSPAASTSKKGKKSNKSVKQFFGEITSSVTSWADDVGSRVQDNVNGGISNVNVAVRQVGSFAQNLGENMQNIGFELDKRRDSTWNQIVRTQQRASSTILSRIPFVKKHIGPFDEDDVVVDENDLNSLNQTRRNIFVPQIAKMLKDSAKLRPITDEIGVIIEPTMHYTHLMFLYLVHFYLVLLLIVSMPDSSTTRLVVKRSSDSTLDSDTDHEERCGASFDDDDLGLKVWNEGVPPAIPRYVLQRNDGGDEAGPLFSESEHDDFNSSEVKPSNMKKALSFFA